MVHLCVCEPTRGDYISIHIWYVSLKTSRIFKRLQDLEKKICSSILQFLWLHLYVYVYLHLKRGKKKRKTLRNFCWNLDEVEDCSDEQYFFNNSFFLILSTNWRFKISILDPPSIVKTIVWLENAWKVRIKVLNLWRNCEGKWLFSSCELNLSL